MQDDHKTKEQHMIELHELRERLAKSEKDKAEHKRAEETLRRVEQQLKLILDTVPALIWQKDREGRYLQVNKAFCDTAGLSAETILGKTDYDLFPMEIADQYVNADREVLSSRTPEFGIERQHQKPSGERRWMRTDKIVLYDIDGHIAGTIGFALDITERKLAAEALWESEGKVNAILGAIADHMAVIDKEHNIVWANATATEMFGNDIIGRKCYKVFHGQEEPCEPYPCIVLKAFQDGRIHEHVTEVVDKEGRTANFHCTATVALRDKDNKPIRVLEISRDVTESKRAEETLRDSEAKYRRIVDTANEGIWSVDGNFITTFVNRRMAWMLGYDESEMIGRPVHWFMFEEDLADLREKMSDRRTGISDRYERRYRHKDGRSVWVILSVTPLVDDKDGSFKGSFAMAVDITERKQAEEALREGETKYRQLFTTVPDAIYIFYADTRQFIDVNEGALRLYGYTREEFLKLELADITAEPELSDATIKETLAAGKVITIPLRLHKRKDGAVFPVEISGGTFLLAGRRVLFAAVRDISRRIRTEEELGRYRDHLEDLVKERTTELERAVGALREEIARRKQTEEAQREAENKYRSLFENAREGIYQSTPEGRYFTVNPTMAKLYGYYSPEEMIAIIDSIDHQIFVIPEKRQELERILATIGEVNDFEVEQRRKDGSTFWASLNVHAVYVEDGSILYWEGRSVDITKRKRAEEALNQSKDQLRFLSSRLLEAQEEERRRIAGDLHDSIGQSLAAIKFNVEHVLKETGKDLNGRIENSLQQIIPLVQNSMEEARKIYTGLRPSTLDDLGIIATISWFCREFQKTYESVRIERQIGIEEAEIPEPLKIVIFRIVQEALNNIAKHSGAGLVNLCLGRKGGRIELAIEDNGTGFDVDSALGRGSHERGLGITGMKERTELSSGTFCIESVIGEGSTIYAAWPMQHHS